MKLNDLTNQEFGFLKVMSRAPNLGSRVMWNCLCKCGNTKIVAAQELLKGDTKSCGCLKREKMRKEKTIHGKSNTKLYFIWKTMRERCEKPYSKRYKNYGGRGIKVCEDWHKFQNFYRWAIENGYHERLSIERKDVNGNYEPNNCTFISIREQANNKQNTIYVKINGNIETLKSLSKETGIKYSTLYGRYSKGLKGDKLITA